MSIVTDDVLTKVAEVIGGEDAIKVVMILKELGEATDDQIFSQMDTKLNDVRKILFKLYNHSIVQCDRSRDENTGWFIFRWRLQPDLVEGFIDNQKRRVLRILKTRLEYEENNVFYCCHTAGCARVTFEDAVENIFRCPTCGEALEHCDNSAFVDKIAEKIKQLEK